VPEAGALSQYAMTPLRQMSYEEFGKLRFLDFFPKTDQYVEDHEGGLESGIGLACMEGYVLLTAFFTSPVDSEWATSEIEMRFGKNGCPEPEGNALLEKLGLELRSGMPDNLVREVLGVSAQVDLWPIVVGDQWPYYLGCAFGESGLNRVWICRKDLADAQTELES
jgi:hypothetical protein